MKIGAMNHPARDVIEEIQSFAALGLDFVDLTLEPPAAACWQLKLTETQRALQESGLSVVGHTAFYLPLASPFESLRRAAIEELRSCFELFAKLGVKWVNLHADGHAPLHEKSFVVERNIESIRELLSIASGLGLGLMLENTPGRFNSAEQLAPFFAALPELGLHLDIGHCNLQTELNTADELLARYASRLKHVHLHDNKGGWGDLHLPLGCGTLDARHYVRSLRRTGYDGTLTLEVFTRDPHYLAYSRDLVRRWWNDAAELERNVSNVRGAASARQPTMSA